MSAKLYMAGTGETGNHGVQTVYWFYCPGCKCSHAVHVPHWSWNDSFDAPSFTPSILRNPDDPKTRCHSWVTDGKIQFFEDSHHTLAGKTVDLPDWEQ